ncbi:MAG TPA: PilX N-terminal domain-containing pilus assembly protein [Burkholderiales bacterium]|nr:PilX N-terminal domain-containing pilus assembly protein [Burkholderiales bacterium]
MSSLHRQRGATLFIGLVMLVVLTLFALSAFQTSSTNLKTVGNMQAREEAQNAAQQVIDTVISSSTFITSPAAAILLPCATPNVACVDLKSGGGIVTNPALADYTVTLTPAPKCIGITTLTNTDLNLDNPSELACATGTTQQMGVAGIDVASTYSLCVNTLWDVSAEATSTSGTKVSISQGIGVRALKVELSPFCS